MFIGCLTVKEYGGLTGQFKDTLKVHLNFIKEHLVSRGISSAVKVTRNTP